MNYQIVDWIRQNQANGYDVNSLREYLLQNNYPAAEVDEAIKAVVTPSPLQPTSLASVEPGKSKDEEEREKKKKMIIWVTCGIAALLILLLLLLFWPSSPQGAPALPSVQASPVNTSFVPDNMTIRSFSQARIGMYDIESSPKKEVITTEALVDLNGNVDMKNNKSHIEATIAVNGTILTRVLPISSSRISVYQIGAMSYSKFDLKGFIETIFSNVAKTVGLSSAEKDKLLTEIESKLEKTLSTKWVKMDESSASKDNPSEGVKMQTLGQKYEEIEGAKVEVIEQDDVSGTKHLRVTLPQQEIINNVNKVPLDSISKLISVYAKEEEESIPADLEQGLNDLENLTKRNINYALAIERYDLEYWVDSQGRIVKNSLAWVFVLNKTTAPYADAELQNKFGFVEIRATSSSYMEIKDYNLVAENIVLPEEANSAIPFEEFMKTVSDEITKGLTSALMPSI